MEKFKTRNFDLLLYPDDESHVKALDYIKSHYDYACILHDCDIDDFGEPKKPHWHVVVKMPNPVWNTSLAKNTGLKLNYVEQCLNFDKSLEYLIHFNNKEKYQYDISQVDGVLSRKLFELINSKEKTESEVILELLEYINTFPFRITVTMFATYCASQGFWSYYRRSGAIFNQIITEHNENLKNNH